MNPLYHKVPCSKCGEPEERYNTVKVATCFNCKRVWQKEYYEKYKNKINKKRREKNKNH